MSFELHEMQGRASRGIVLPVLLILIGVASTSISTLNSQGLIAKVYQQSAPSSSTSQLAVIAVNPSNISDVSRTAGQVWYTVNVYNSSAINLFYVTLTYNYATLHAASIDYSNNVLGPGASVLYDCKDNVGSCGPQDDTGVVTLSLYLLGNVSVTPPQGGVLFTVMFNVVGTGLSQIHLTSGAPYGSVLLLGGSDVPLTTQDGYFDNALCAGVLCTPPVPDFLISPSIAYPFETLTFNASSSTSTNQGALIRDFLWSFGDLSLPVQLTSSTVQHRYDYAGNYSVTLTVSDSYGVSWSKSITVAVIAIEPPRLSSFFTRQDGGALRLDSNGSPTVEALLNNDTVQATKPSIITEWLNVTDTGSVVFHSLSINEILPAFWTVSPPKDSSSGGVSVLFQFANGTTVNITNEADIIINPGFIESVLVSLPDLTANQEEAAFRPGDSIMIKTDLTYSLVGTKQTTVNYPQVTYALFDVNACTDSQFQGGRTSSLTNPVFLVIDGKVLNRK